ncbi:hypothetical protein [Roseateles sp.]|uniref:hypothetical protein n=1 Tax=Roseateles sp. TaxID=1971397 RepID=UPI00286A3F6B|nr:hypothetical protein [Roseateles sp.]
MDGSGHIADIAVASSRTLRLAAAKPVPCTRRGVLMQAVLAHTVNSARIFTAMAHGMQTHDAQVAAYLGAAQEKQGIWSMSK